MNEIDAHTRGMLQVRGMREEKRRESESIMIKIE